MIFGKYLNTSSYWSLGILVEINTCNTGGIMFAFGAITQHGHFDG
jgi:hypothetical protein